jgi:hypothetical protein
MTLASLAPSGLFAALGPRNDIESYLAGYSVFKSRTRECIPIELLTPPPLIPA